MLPLPFVIPVLFIVATMFTIWQFYVSSNRDRVVLFVLVAWLILQSGLSLNGFYLVTNSLPPRFSLLALPPLLTIVFLFISDSGRRFIDRFDLGKLTIIHYVRVVVEIVLFLLYIHRYVPELMTFAGRNFDILAGVSAPFVYYFFIRRKFNRKVVLYWNVICLLLLLNIVGHAILSAPSPFQQLAFDQPNVAVLYFPFVWLPCCVVPIVLFAHLVAIRRLTR